MNDVLGPDLGTWQALCYLNFTITFTGKYYYYPYFIDEDTEIDSPLIDKRPRWNLIILSDN